jgi:hypothetical protein
MNCININHPEYKSLVKETGMNEEILKAKISLWQDIHGNDKFPTANYFALEELFDSNPELANQVYEALGVKNNNNQITPQQKQQALQLYSQYLESLNTVVDSLFQKAALIKN